MGKNQLKRFWSKVDVRGPNECWNWKASKRNEYGLFWIRARTYGAHRIAWYLTHGKIPRGLCVCHHCDNPSCVNPSHLFLGTQGDNQLDAVRKGRKSKLTVDEVREIREIQDEGGWTQQEIADAFGVDRSTIYSIKRGKTWFWLGETE